MTSPSDPAPSMESLLTHSQWLTALARRLVVGTASADDLVQDTWVAALRNPPRQAHSLRAWLSKVARRLARANDQVPDVRKYGSMAHEDSPAADDVVARIQQERLLAKLVVELEEPYRRVILQRFYQGLDAARIARTEGIPQPTVRTRLRRALALLRERMERELGSDRQGWPLASVLLIPKAGALSTIKNGVMLMTTTSTKTTIAISAASGVLCALAVTEGILPRLQRQPLSTETSIASELRDALPTPSSGTKGATYSTSPVGEFGLSGAPLANGQPRAPALSEEDLRKLLLSSNRIDQIRAIDLLRQEGSATANQILVDALLATKDPVLIALLEEAMLQSPKAFAPAILHALLSSEDRKLLGRLPGLLTEMVQREPDLAREVAGPLVEALEESDASPDRTTVATEALKGLGVAAAGILGEHLVDRASSPKGAGSAAWLIAQLPGEHADVVREKLSEGLRSANELLEDSTVTEEERSTLQQKSGSIGWAASLRPESEHDSLGGILLNNLLRTNDPAQAGTLAWSMGNLKGLTDNSRVSITRELLDRMDTQSSDALRYQYTSTLKQLALSQPVGPHFHELVQMAQDARRAHAVDGKLVPLLDRLLADLHAHEKDEIK